jgi:hypothetical protein
VLLSQNYQMATRLRSQPRHRHDRSNLERVMIEIVRAGRGADILLASTVTPGPPVGFANSVARDLQGILLMRREA